MVQFQRCKTIVSTFLSIHISQKVPICIYLQFSLFGHKDIFMDDCHLNNITKLMIFLKKHFVAPCSAYTIMSFLTKNIVNKKIKYFKISHFYHWSFKME
jgi:hypothetical protein